jgi:hypothetical protein
MHDTLGIEYAEYRRYGRSDDDLGPSERVTLSILRDEPLDVDGYTRAFEFNLWGSSSAESFKLGEKGYEVRFTTATQTVELTTGNKPVISIGLEDYLKNLRAYAVSKGMGNYWGVSRDKTNIDAENDQLKVRVALQSAQVNISKESTMAEQVSGYLLLRFKNKSAN